MIRCMNVDEVRGVCKDRSRWRSVISAYPHGKRREFDHYRAVVRIDAYRIEEDRAQLLE